MKNNSRLSSKSRSRRGLRRSLQGRRTGIKARKTDSFNYYHQKTITESSNQSERRAPQNMTIISKSTIKNKRRPFQSKTHTNGFGARSFSQTKGRQFKLDDPAERTYSQNFYATMDLREMTKNYVTSFYSSKDPSQYLRETKGFFPVVKASSQSKTQKRFYKKVDKKDFSNRSPSKLENLREYKRLVAGKKRRRAGNSNDFEAASRFFYSNLENSSMTGLSKTFMNSGFIFNSSNQGDTSLRMANRTTSDAWRLKDHQDFIKSNIMMNTQKRPFFIKKKKAGAENMNQKAPKKKFNKVKKVKKQSAKKLDKTSNYDSKKSEKEIEDDIIDPAKKFEDTEGLKSKDNKGERNNNSAGNKSKKKALNQVIQVYDAKALQVEDDEFDKMLEYYRKEHEHNIQDEKNLLASSSVGASSQALLQGDLQHSSSFGLESPSSAARNPYLMHSNSQGIDYLAQHSKDYIAERSQVGSSDLNQSLRQQSIQNMSLHQVIDENKPEYSRKLKISSKPSPRKMPEKLLKIVQESSDPQVIIETMIEELKLDLKVENFRNLLSKMYSRFREVLIAQDNPAVQEDKKQAQSRHEKPTEQISLIEAEIIKKFATGTLQHIEGLIASLEADNPKKRRPQEVKIQLKEFNLLCKRLVKFCEEIFLEKFKESNSELCSFYVYFRGLTKKVFDSELSAIRVQRDELFSTLTGADKDSLEKSGILPQNKAWEMYADRLKE